jgi:single-stranded DNA-binding protein
MSQRSLQIRLYGNLGADPVLHTFSSRTVTREFYDEIIDDAVDREITQPTKRFRTVSLAVNGRDQQGLQITHWHRLVDTRDHLALFRKGDRIQVHGYFHDREYVKDGETHTIRELIVTFAKPERLKVRFEAA